MNHRKDIFQDKALRGTDPESCSSDVVRSGSFLYTPSKEIYIHPDAIHEYRGNLQQLSLYYKLKYTYHNSTIYNWTYKAISQKLGYSYYLTRKNIKWLIENGLAYKHKKNLVLLSVNKFYRQALGNYSAKRFHLLKIYHRNTVKQVEDELRFILLSRKVAQQRNVCKVKSDINMLDKGKPVGFSLRYIKKLNKKRRSLNGLEKASADIYFGTRNLAESWGVSHTYANWLLQKWVKENRIRTLPKKKRLGPFYEYLEPEELKEEMGGRYGFYCCTSEGIIIYYGTKIMLQDYIYYPTNISPKTNPKKSKRIVK
jgi:hypothetical protein